ncbi:MAG: hypothetical protein ABUS56_03975 [Acidobacteriota bacterium]
MPRTHSFEHAGAYPDFPVLRLLGIFWGTVSAFDMHAALSINEFVPI